MRIMVANTERRQAYKIDEFRGVDYASSPLETASYRATDIANFELVDGVLHKRKGWEQVQKIANADIVSVYEYSPEYMLVQTYHPTYSDGLNNRITAYKKHMGRWVSKGYMDFPLKDRVSAKYYKRGATVYIVCGTIDTFTLTIDSSGDERISFGAFPYVPTTTINILPERVIQGTLTESVEVEGIKKEVNESANLLQPYRYNELYYDIPKADGEKYFYYLDDSIYYEQDNPPSIDFYDANGEPNGSVTDLTWNSRIGPMSL